MKSHLKFPIILSCVGILITLICQSGIAQVVTVEVLGSNSPLGNSYSEQILLGGGAQLVADGTLEVTPNLFNLPGNEYFFETRYTSTTGSFVNNTDGNWFANFRLNFNDPTTNSQTYFWYEDSNGPVELSFNGWGGDIISHPFETGFDVASFNSSRDAELEHQFGIFSNPFTGNVGSLGVDASSVTGFGLGVRLATAVPEPSSAALLFASMAAVTLRWRR